MNDFEQSLKEQADKFQMVPSKKVWFGIYNDLHPGKRWPSVTMSLLLIFTLVVIGHLNTNNSRRLSYVTEKIPGTVQLTPDLERTTRLKNSQRIVVRKTDIDKAREALVYSTRPSDHMPLSTRPAASDMEATSLHPASLSAGNLITSQNLRRPVFEESFMPVRRPGFDDVHLLTAGNTAIKETPQESNIGGIIAETLPAKTIENNINSKLTAKILPAKKMNSNDENLSEDKNIQHTNKAANPEKKVARLYKKAHDQVSWVYFAGPAVNNVSLSGEPLKEPPRVGLTAGLPLIQKSSKVLHNSSLGFEAGVLMNYAFAKKLRFITGVHLTYSGYNIISNEMHPTPATLVLRDPSTGGTYQKSYETHYGDGTGQSTAIIHNYNVQASIPVGLQYEFAGNTKVQFNLSADVEPSLVLKSNAYMQSSDGNNYINDPSLLRNLNMSSNFGAFVSFSSIKFKWQIGPNFRYQWLSTYRKDYTVKEHLIDYGIRLGISK